MIMLIAAISINDKLTVLVYLDHPRMLELKVVIVLLDL